METKKLFSKWKIKKNPQKNLNEMEASKISDAEFKTMVIRLLKGFKQRVDGLSENLNSKH